MWQREKYSVCRKLFPNNGVSGHHVNRSKEQVFWLPPVRFITHKSAWSMRSINCSRFLAKKSANHSALISNHKRSMKENILFTQSLFFCKLIYCFIGKNFWQTLYFLSPQRGEMVRVRGGRKSFWQRVCLWRLAPSPEFPGLSLGDIWLFHPQKTGFLTANIRDFRIELN